jgi:acetyl esterase
VTGLPFEVDVEDVVVQGEGAGALLGRLFRPRGAGPFAAAVDVHGGAWVQGDRTGNDPINLRLAAQGIVVLAVDHRLPPAGVHPAAVQDINHAVRWLKAHAADWSVQVDRVGLTGTSAGGHLALLTALKPHDVDFAALPVTGGHDAEVAFCVALWPVVCPLRRYREVVLDGSGAAAYPGRAATTTKQMTYWLTEAAMAAGSPLAATQRGDTIALPPMLIVQSPADPLHPLAHARAFADAYRARGGRIALHLVEGEPYYLVRSDPDSPAGREAIARIVAFIRESQVRAAA